METAKKAKASGRPGRIPELDGLRILMIFIVSWFHVWQQSWLEPAIRIPFLQIDWSLDSLVRSGYVWVDGTLLLSAFLLYLPLARQGRGAVLRDVPEFYRRKARRILPGFWFIILLFFFGMCLPWGLYNGNTPYMLKDLFTHLALVFPFFRDTYIFTPMGAAPWTLAIAAQMYLLFPLLAKAMAKKPCLVLGVLAVSAWGFRAWCMLELTDYAMVVNTLANFLDVYAIGFGCAMVFARLEKVKKARAGSPSGKKWVRILVQVLATAVFFGCLAGIYALQKVQATAGILRPDKLQWCQMMYRPAFVLGFAGLILSAPFSLRLLRFLLGNRVTSFLAGVSMNYYLVHQTLAVHLRYRLRFPPSVAENPNMASEQPWQTQYTLLVFGASLLLAVAITYLIEKPAGRLLNRQKK